MELRLWNDTPEGVNGLEGVAPTRAARIAQIADRYEWEALREQNAERVPSHVREVRLLISGKAI